MNQQGQMAMGGPVNAPTPNSGGVTLVHDEVLKRLNTAIYDYLLRNSHYDVARAVSSGLPLFTKDDKQSPNQRNGQQPNGVDGAMEIDSKDPGITERPSDLPLPSNVFEGPFLQDWWFQFWEIHFARRSKNPNPNASTTQYVAHQRAQQKQRMSMMGGGMDPASMQNLRGYNGMVQGMNNGMAGMPNDLKRTAMQNQRNMTPHQMAALKNMQGNQQQMQGTQMERSGSQMDAGGPRSGSPGSGDAPSPKRPRLEGGNMQHMNQGRPGQPGQMQGNQGMPPNMGPGGAQGSPMSQQGMDGPTSEFYAATQGRMPMQANNPQAVAAAAAQGNNNGNHALQDYQMQLMLLEQQNKKRLLMARQEQDSMTHPGAQPNGQFPSGASPQGVQRAGNPSPNPSDMQRGMMDPSQVPPNVRAQMMQNGQMMRPPSSHPVNQMPPNQQQMEMMRQQGQMMPNGSFPPGQQPPGGMMPGQQGPGGQQAMGTPRSQNSAMPPPPAPPANSSGTGPSSPSQQSAAPPTPSQSNKPKPGTKNEPKKKGAANKKGGNAPNATPASESEQPPTPTPATPITPMNANSFGKGQQMPNGQASASQQANAQAHSQNQQQQQNAVQPPAPAGGQPDMTAPFGSLGESNQFPDMNLDFTLEGGDVLDNFDFDSFLNNDGDGGFGFDANLAFGDGLDTGIENN